MTKAEQIAFKQQLKQVAQTIIEQRIAATRLLMQEAQQSANQEEKSSAGDKYETARAMGHLQKDMHARQLAEHSKELASLHTISVETILESAQPGALIQCQNFALFIAAGLGKQVIEGKAIIYLSPQAPLTRQIMHKKAGDSFVLNNLQTIIVTIY